MMKMKWRWLAMMKRRMRSKITNKREIRIIPIFLIRYLFQTKSPPPRGRDRKIFPRDPIHNIPPPPHPLPRPLKTIRPIKGPSSTRDKSEKLGKNKSIIKTQNNPQLDRIEEEPSEIASEKDFEENGTTNTTPNLLKRTTKNTCKTDKIQRPDADEDDNDDSMKLRSGRRVRFEN
jgi:hypothetical protein